MQHEINGNRCYHDNIVAQKRMAYNASNAMDATRRWKEDRTRVGRAQVKDSKHEDVEVSTTDVANKNSESIELTTTLAT